MKNEPEKPFKTRQTGKVTIKGLKYHLPDPETLKDFLALHPAAKTYWRAWLERESLRLDKSHISPVTALLSAAAALMGLTYVIQLPEITAQNADYEATRKESLELQALIRETEESGVDIGQDLRDALTREPLKEFSFFENAASSIWSVAFSFLAIAGIVFCTEWLRGQKAAQYATWLSAIVAATAEAKASVESSKKLPWFNLNPWRDRSAKA